jgi:hypothetical protein
MDCKRLTAPGQTFWHTALNYDRFVASQDRKDYS